MFTLKPADWAFECDLTEGHDTSVRAPSVEEALNTPYEVSLSIDTQAPDLEMEDFLGKDAALVLFREPLAPRRFCGIIQEVELDVGSTVTILNDDGTPDEADIPSSGGSFELRIRPALYMLGFQRDSRIFQNQTVPEIVEEVLKEALASYEREVRLELQEEYPSREYCVQYTETNLAFVQRLLEEEGISLGFDHAGEKEVIVLRDKNASFAKVDTLPEPGLLKHRPAARVLDADEPVLSFSPIVRQTQNKVVLRDNDFTRNGLFFEGETGEADALGRERVSYEHGSRRSLTIHDYESGVRRYQKEDSQRQTRIRLEEHQRDDRAVYSAVSAAIHVEPGTTFEIQPGADDLKDVTGMYGEYVVTRVHHSSGSALPGDGYANHFDCIPKEREYRPYRNERKPRIAGIQTAIVTGPEGEEIHVDEYGRIKVQFYWDRKGELDDKTSCWIRCQQTWAGNGFGSWWVPRIGMEVIVQFVDGDADRPIVTGCVYNADNALPYALPDEKTKSTIKSNSTIGGEGFNEFRFEDKKGQEEIWLHAQKDLNEKVLNNHTLNVGNDETIEIGNDQTQIIGNNQTEYIKANQIMTVDANRTVAINGNEERTVMGSITEIVNSGETRTINSGQTVTVNAGETKSVNGGQTNTVNGGRTENVTGGIGQKVAGGITRDVVGGMIDTVVGDAKLEVQGQIDMSASALITQLAPRIERLEANMNDVSSSKTWFTELSASVAALKADFTVLAISTWGVKLSAGGVNLAAYGLNRSVEALKSDNSAVTTTGSGLEVNMDGVRIIT